MSVRFDVDDKAFDQLDRALSSPDAVLRDISVALAEESLNLVREGFGKAADPYGRGWAEKAKGDGRKPLHGPSGVLRNSYNRKRADADGFEIVSAGVKYAAYHQDGFKTRRGTGKKSSKVGSLARVPARKMVPDDDIPPAWEQRFGDTVDDILDELFDG